MLTRLRASIASPENAGIEIGVFCNCSPRRSAVTTTSSRAPDAGAETAADTCCAIAAGVAPRPKNQAKAVRVAAVAEVKRAGLVRSPALARIVIGYSSPTCRIYGIFLSRCSNLHSCNLSGKNVSIEPRRAERRIKRDQLSVSEKIAAERTAYRP